MLVSLVRCLTFSFSMVYEMIWSYLYETQDRSCDKIFSCLILILYPKFQAFSNTAWSSNMAMKRQHHKVLHSCTCYLLYNSILTYRLQWNATFCFVVHVFTVHFHKALCVIILHYCALKSIICVTHKGSFLS